MNRDRNLSKRSEHLMASKNSFFLFVLKATNIFVPTFFCKTFASVLADGTAKRLSSPLSFLSEDHPSIMIPSPTSPVHHKKT